jgi:hypothetical protein
VFGLEDFKPNDRAYIWHLLTHNGASTYIVKFFVGLIRPNPGPRVSDFDLFN